MITFADEAALTVLVQDVPTNIQETNMAQALTFADQRIRNKVQRVTLPHPTPDAIIQAANLYAAVIILDAYYKSNEARNPAAAAWEKQAKELIDDYLDANPEDRKASKITFNTVHVQLTIPLMMCNMLTHSIVHSRKL
jgi:hypothetical protein